MGRLRRPHDMLIYYGWLNAFNSATNAWTNELVAQDLAKYGVLVFGDGVQDPTHGDYANAQAIIARILELRPDCQIFGYVSINQSEADFKLKAAKWKALDVQGIFLDEAGYDYGSAATNGREAFNIKVEYVHSMEMRCMANAWNPDHVLSLDNDVSYPNTTYNPDKLDSALDSDDVYLLESHAITSAPAYEAEALWYDRAAKVLEKYSGLIPIAACSVIDDTDAAGQAKFDYIYISALMWGWDMVGSSDLSYGASNARSKMWVRPDMSRLSEGEWIAVEKDAANSKYYRYLRGSRLVHDHTAASESAAIEIH
jgi:hypothetical protein